MVGEIAARRPPGTRQGGRGEVHNDEFTEERLGSCAAAV